LLSNQNADDEEADDGNTQLDQLTIIQIIGEFDHLAMETLTKGIPELYNYLIGPQQQ
jgi:hypothetical protein